MRNRAVNLLLAALLLAALPLPGGITSLVKTPAAAAGGIEDDFEGDLSKWTQLSGTDPFTIQTSGGSEVLRTSTTSSGTIIYTDEQTSTISQWAMVQYVNSEVTNPHFAGLYFRSTNNASEYAYTARVESAHEVVWRSCKGHSCWDIQGTTTTDIYDGDYYGIEVTGTADDTVVKVWDFGSSPPADRGSWGSATDTLTDNPNSARRADVGKYVGIYDGSGASYDEFDNFSAGDI